MLPVFFFRIITLDGEQRKGCKGGVHNPGSMTFLCRQQQNQLQTTQRWFAGEQREKTAESFLTSSCSSLPWGYCCRREEGSWWPLTRGGQGFKDSIISLKDLNLNQCPKPGLPTSGRALHPPTPHTLPGLLIPRGSFPLSLLLRARSAEAVHGQRSWISLGLLSARRAAAPEAAGHPQQHRLSPLSLHGHDSENMECVLLLLLGDRFFWEVFVSVFLKLQSRLQF